MSASVTLVEAAGRNDSDLIKMMAKQIEDRDTRIKQLEKLNSQLALRIDQLEAEKKD
jgi:hypothetical protein